MIAPCTIELKLGQKWAELDTRWPDDYRIVEICGFDEGKQKVQIRGARPTWAMLKRFHGKNGGYRYVSEV